MMESYGAHNYHPLPVMLREGRGAFVYDTDGREYLDFLSCYSALNFGHNHPRLVSSLKNQIDKLSVCSRAFYSEELSYFSEELAKFCGLEMVLAMNSGAEAVETALKIARKWGYEKKKVASDQAHVIAFQNNFHGRTIAIVSFSTEPTYRTNFGPFLAGFQVVPFGDLATVERSITPNTVAILVEPIQAEAGILIPPAGFLSGLKTLCLKHNLLLILDEIQTGLGRTGKNCCFEHESGAKPDLLVLGKSLGGGLLPVSAVVGTKEVMDVIRPGQHGSTFGGNPLACAVAREALRVLKEEGLSERALEIGKRVESQLKADSFPLVKEIRGKGALIGIELKPEAGGARRYAEKLSERGVLCKETHEHVIRIAPPLTIDFKDLDRGVGEIVGVLRSL